MSGGGLLPWVWLSGDGKKKKPERDWPRWWVFPLFIAVIVPWWIGVYEIARWLLGG